jgi:chromosome segregation ATPase
VSDSIDALVEKIQAGYEGGLWITRSEAEHALAALAERAKAAEQYSALTTKRWNKDLNRLEAAEAALKEAERECELRVKESAAANRLISEQKVELERLRRVEEALIGTGWKDADGLCWCSESQEITGRSHRPQCIEARSALAAASPREGEGE